MWAGRVTRRVCPQQSSLIGREHKAFLVIFPETSSLNNIIDSLGHVTCYTVIAMVASHHSESSLIGNNNFLRNDVNVYLNVIFLVRYLGTYFKQQ